MSKWIPTAPEVVRGAISTLAGAAIIAGVLSQFPSVRRWFGLTR